MYLSLGKNLFHKCPSCWSMLLLCLPQMHLDKFGRSLNPLTLCHVLLLQFLLHPQCSFLDIRPGHYIRPVLIASSLQFPRHQTRFLNDITKVKQNLQSYFQLQSKEPGFITLLPNYYERFIPYNNIQNNILHYEQLSQIGLPNTRSEM